MAYFRVNPTLVSFFRTLKSFRVYIIYMLIYWYLFSDLGFADDTLKITGPQGVTLPFQ